MSFAVFLTFLLTSVALGFLWVKRKFSYFRENGFLHEEPTFPFGNLKGVVTSIHPVYITKRIYDKFKGKAPACGVYRLFSPAVLILDLDLVKDILIRDFDSFHNRGLYYNEKVSHFVRGKSLINGGNEQFFHTKVIFERSFSAKFDIFVLNFSKKENLVNFS